MKSLDTQGSANWPTLAHATRFLRFTGEPFRKERDKWLAFFDTSKRRFMGREVGSRIYLPWHFLPVCAVWESAERSGDSTVATEAKNWRLFVAAWFGVCSLLAGVLILVMPRLLNMIVAVYLIAVGLVGLLGVGALRLN